MKNNQYPLEYDAIVGTIQKDIDGCRQGRNEMMRPVFHADASFFGYVDGQLASGTKFLFDWIDRNGPAPRIEPRFVSVDILDSIAVVRLEASGWSGKLSGGRARASDVFTLLKRDGEWKITHKLFHCHDS